MPWAEAWPRLGYASHGEAASLLPSLVASGEIVTAHHDAVGQLTLDTSELEAYAYLHDLLDALHAAWSALPAHERTVAGVDTIWRAAADATPPLSLYGSA